MPGVFSRRLFPLLQLTRMALVFTAISNSLCELLILTHQRYPDAQNILKMLDWRQVGAVMLMSTGLYGFGMSLNDIIDRLVGRVLDSSASVIQHLPHRDRIITQRHNEPLLHA